MDCRRRLAVDDDRSRRWVVDDDRYPRRWAVDDNDRSRIAFYQAQTKVYLDRIDANLNRIDKNLRSIRRRRMSSTSSSASSSSASRERRQFRNKPTVVEDYPPLDLPLRWRDPPPECKVRNPPKSQIRVPASRPTFNTQAHPTVFLPLDSPSDHQYASRSASFHNHMSDSDSPQQDFTTDAQLTLKPAIPTSPLFRPKKPMKKMQLQQTNEDEKTPKQGSPESSCSHHVVFRFGDTVKITERDLVQEMEPRRFPNGEMLEQREECSGLERRGSKSCPAFDQVSSNGDEVMTNPLGFRTSIEKVESNVRTLVSNAGEKLSEDTKVYQRVDVLEEIISDLYPRTPPPFLLTTQPSIHLQNLRSSSLCSRELTPAVEPALSRIDSTYSSHEQPSKLHAMGSRPPPLALPIPFSSLASAQSSSIYEGYYLRLTFLVAKLIEIFCSHQYFILGFESKAVEVFDKMLKEGIIQYDVAFTASLLEEVNLLGQAGLKEAYKFMKYIPIEPRAGVWGIFLLAFKMQCNTKLAEILWLSEVDTQNAGSFVSMSNVFAADNRWIDASQKWIILIASNLEDKMAVHHHHREKLFDPSGLVTLKLRWERYAEIYPSSTLVFILGVSNFMKVWLLGENSSPINRQSKFKVDYTNQNESYMLQIAISFATLSEMLVQFNESKTEPLDWEKHLQVIILKSAFKIFDPGGLIL